MKYKISILSHYTALGISVVMTLVLTSELILSANGKSLCPTAACEVVAKYVRFGEPLLLAAGACFFLILAGAIFFARKYQGNNWLAAFPLLTLIGAASFDGAIIGFQYVTLAQKCTICLAVAAAITTVAIAYAASIKMPSIALLCITAWVAGFTGNATLLMPDTTAPRQSMIFYERHASKEIKQAPSATFVFSMKCPHCTDVLKYLGERNPDDMTWRFAIIDADKKAINKLGYFYEEAAASDNPFRLVVESKKSAKKLTATTLEKFPELTRSARVFLANNSIKGVPLLIIATKRETTFYKGSTAILKYLKKRYLDPS